MAAASLDLAKYRGPLVTLKVGVEETVISVHKSVLDQSEYFRACLGGGRFVEGQLMEVKLVDEEVGIMERLVYYFYTGNVFVEKTSAGDLSWSERQLLAKMFVAADRYLMEDMKNDIVDLYIECHGIKRLMVWPSSVAVLDKAGLEDSPLKAFLLEFLADDIVRCKQSAGTSFGSLVRDLPGYSDGLQAIQSQDVSEMFIKVNAIANGRSHMGTDAEWKAKLHTHTRTPKCKPCSQRKRKQPDDGLGRSISDANFGYESLLLAGPSKTPTVILY